jgi:hypothetical protein
LGLQLLLLALPSVLFPIALAVLWLGGERWRRYLGRPLARGVAIVGSVYAALAALAVVLSMGSSMKSLGNFQVFVFVAFFAVWHVVMLVAAGRSARRGTARPWGVAAALLGLFGLFVIGAGAMPSVQRSQVSVNESTTVGDIRMLLAAEDEYALRNHGFFDVPDCLVQAEQCLPDLPRGASPFLPRESLAEVVHGYRRTFHPGPPAPPAVAKRLAPSRTSLTAFAFVAVPVEPGRTGLRAFCGANGRPVCARLDGTMPVPIAGTCPAECDPLP